MATETSGLHDIPSALVAGRYHLIRIIGKGGMGTVYEAENVGIGRRVALKLLDAGYARDEILRKRFEREARTATAIEHPNVVEMLDSGIADPDSPFIVMELLQGETLRERILREETLTTAETAYIALQVLHALGNAHARGVVHRDLKPDNVFLVARAGDRSFVKLLDFGISKIQSEHTGNLDLTVTGSVMGTPRYMSPEQARGQTDLDHRVDVFGTGVLLFEMLVGKPPHEGQNYNALVASLIEQPAPALGELRLDAPEELAALVDRALLRDREHRPGVVEMLAVLRRLLPPEILTATLQTDPPPPMSALSSLQTSGVRTPVRAAGIGSSPSNPRVPGPGSRASHPGQRAASSVPTPLHRSGVLPGADAPTVAMRGSSAPSAGAGHYPSPFAETDPQSGGARSAPRRRATWIAASLAIVVATGVAVLGLRPWASSPARPGAPVDAPVPSFAAGGPVLRFATVRYLPAGTQKRDQSPIARHLERETHERVEEVTIDDFEQVQLQLRSHQLDLAMLNPLSFVRLRTRGADFVPLAAATADGARTYQGAFVTRMNSAITKLEQIKGTTVCWVSPTSTSGYLFPRNLLRHRGMDPERTFRQGVISGDHVAALRALRDGTCDVAAVMTSAVFNARDEGLSPGTFRILQTTEDIPLDVIVARGDLEPARREAVRKALLAVAPGSDLGRKLAEGTFSRIDGFAPVVDSDYDRVREAARLEAEHK